jgi:hypothetical protein
MGSLGESQADVAEGHTAPGGATSHDSAVSGEQPAQLQVNIVEPSSGRVQPSAGTCSHRGMGSGISSSNEVGPDARAHIDRSESGYAMPLSNNFNLNHQVRNRRNAGEHFSFPAPSGINVNMMPIDLWQPEETVPAEIWRGYSCWIRAIQLMVPKTRKPHVAYLTVRECEVQPGQTQSRAGLHIERPNFMLQGGRVGRKSVRFCCAGVRNEPARTCSSICRCMCHCNAIQTANMEILTVTQLSTAMVLYRVHCHTCCVRRLAREHKLCTSV